MVNRKEKFLGELDVLKEQKQKLEEELESKEQEFRGYQGSKILKGEEFKQYANALRGKSTNYKRYGTPAGYGTPCLLWNPLPVMEPPAGLPWTLGRPHFSKWWRRCLSNFEWGTDGAHWQLLSEFGAEVCIAFWGAHRALCLRCANSRLFSTTGSQGFQGPEFCTPDAVLNGSCMPL